MSGSVEYRLNKASELEIARHLSCSDADFMPPLSSRVEINDYAIKIVSNATRFEAWSGDTMIGLVAAYCNSPEKRIAYITSVSVMKAWTGHGIAATLLKHCIAHATTLGMQQISLEVAYENARAIELYERSGFVALNVNAPFVTMDLHLKSGEAHGQ